jgi:S-adenosylmethionine:tRNA ribosyltransferase-isomerase
MIETRRIDYVLPPELIAQHPSDRRDGSRLLVVERRTRAIEHRQFSDLPQYLRAGDLLFRNTASVLPARLFGSRPTGGRVECLLLRPLDRAGTGDEVWQCLLRPGKKLPVGARFDAADGGLAAEVTAKAEDGTAAVRLVARAGTSVVAVANQAGEVPLPPYIERSTGSGSEDRSRYQTVYADPSRQVAVAAPTAGLHFTRELIDRLADSGVGFRDLTLHVGMGTFKPIATDTVEEHAIHREVYEIPVDTQRALFPPLSGRRVAVGTTTVRSVEDFLGTHRAPLTHPHVAEAALYIYPPRRFRGVDALITNFHQPRSTLLCLVASFLTPDSMEGLDWLMAIYAEAVRLRYRFFSYGDAMLIL